MASHRGQHLFRNRPLHNISSMYTRAVYINRKKILLRVKQVSSQIHVGILTKGILIRSPAGEPGSNCGVRFDVENEARGTIAIGSSAS